MLEDVQQFLAGDTAESMPAGRDRRTLEVHVDVVPVCEIVDDLLVGRRICGAEVLERLIGENNAPAERVVGAVSLDHRDAVTGISAFHEDGEIQSGGTTTNRHDLHEVPPRGATL